LKFLSLLNLKVNIFQIKFINAALLHRIVLCKRIFT